MFIRVAHLHTPAHMKIRTYMNPHGGSMDNNIQMPYFNKFPFLLSFLNTTGNVNAFI